MTLINDRHRIELRAAGWNTRGYLPHFDGIATPQFITLCLADSLPKKVIGRWKEELKTLSSKREKILLQNRIESYLDQGYGKAFLRDPQIAGIGPKPLF